MAFSSNRRPKGTAQWLFRPVGGPCVEISPQNSEAPSSSNQRHAQKSDVEPSSDQRSAEAIAKEHNYIIDQSDANRETTPFVQSEANT